MKKAVSIALATLMIASSLTACTGAPAQSQAAAPSTPAESKAETSSEAAPEGPDISAPVTLKWMLDGNTVTDDKAVLEKANAILKEKLNVTLQPIWCGWDNFNEKATLAINGGDDVDIYFTSSWTANEYNIYSRKGAYVRLDNPDNNLIEKYGSDIWGMLPDSLKTGSKTIGQEGAGVYALPNYKDVATQNTWDINVPLLKKYGYTLDDIKSAGFYGFGDIMKKVKEGEEKAGGKFYPMLVESAVLERMVNNTTIITGDVQDANVLSYYMDPTDITKPSSYGNKILSKFETPEYKKFAEQMRAYFQAGYVDPAMGNADQANAVRTSTQKTGKYLIGTQSYSLGYELEASTLRGFEVAMVPVTDAYVDTTGIQGGMMAISTASKNPERAMMFLNLLNTNNELMTLLNYGVEGNHYNLKDGLVELNMENRKSYSPWTNGMGNVTILTPTVPQGANFWTGFKDYYGNAKAIPIAGWAFDGSTLTNEYGALANVYAEYALALNTGTVDPAVKLPEFIEKLKANGLDKVVAEANAQLDKYMATKG